LNAVIRAVAKAAAKRGWETVGFLGGYEGLLEPQQFMALDYQRVGGLLTRGGTILGTANKGRFSAKVGHGKTRCLPRELIDGVKEGMEKMNIRGLVTIGGDGSLSIAQQLFEGGVPLVGVPKTIDNDLEGTTMTFGFDSAVACATDALDRLHTTAESHNRVMLLEVMGRYAGWIALYAGVAGGGDVILIPEIPFDYESICAKIQEREAQGKHFTLVVVAEGARPKGGDFVTSADQPANREARLGGIGAVVGREIEIRTGKECRVCVLGHLQRGGSPTNFDRVLCSMFGAAAVEMIAAGEFGRMVAYQGANVGSVPITDAIGRLKTVVPSGNLIRTARALGISMGDWGEAIASGENASLVQLHEEIQDLLPVLA
jgi:6-phosphofructokinase 1